MNIGFVSTWFERGAAYVTKAYIEALNEEHNTFIYARGGESTGKNDPKWDSERVEWGLNLYGTKINKKHFFNWIKRNKIELVFFNEQREYIILAELKKHFPKIIIGSYVDYYTESDLQHFRIYDFLVCNTERHYSVFKEYSQCHYLPWGTDIEIFKPVVKKNQDLVFFHSVGMSTRKGTDLLLNAYIDGEIYKHSQLLIHSQLDFKKTFGYDQQELHQYNIEIIEKTVSAPGLYHKGDVYVYPTKLDGLGLTIYEALSCGLPVITTNIAPMNEIVNDSVGYLVDVEKQFCRSDGYYWPLSICNKESLIKGMRKYLDQQSNLAEIKQTARNYAAKNLNWMDRYSSVNEIFSSAKRKQDDVDYDTYISSIKKKKINQLGKSVIDLLPDRLINFIYK